MDDVEFLRDLLQNVTSGSVDVAKDSSELCSDLLNCLSRNPKAASQVGEIFAVLASESSFRVEAGSSEVLPALLPCLSTPDLHTRLQTLRAIGNLCIDNDQNREVVLLAGGCQALLKQIERCCDSSQEEFLNSRYKCVVCGCLLNMAADNDKLSQAFLLEGALEKLCSLLATDQPKEVVRYALEALSALVDTADQETLASQVFLQTLLHLLLSLANQKQWDSLKLLLELIKTVIEKEGETLSLKLIEAGICKQLLQIDHADYLQQAVDILVLLLNRDKCMQAVFEDGETVGVAIRWLEATDSSMQLQMANAALIIANMARSDSNCISLVKDGVIPQLIAVTKLEETELFTGKLHHAALCALRNLSLLNDHKGKFLSLGVVDCAIQVLKVSTMPHVQFKAIGILRLLVENQASTCSCVIMEAMERLCEVCEESGISHVHVEVGRLLSAVVKYCQDRDILMKVTKEGGVKWIYDLLRNELPQLIGEGLIAINIIMVLFKEEAFAILLEEASSSISSCLISILTSSFPLNLINNVLVLIDTLLSLSADISVLKSCIEVKEAVEKFTSHENEAIKMKSKEILLKL